MKLATRIAVLAAAGAAFVVAAPASAAPASAAPVTCWTEATLDKVGTFVVGTYYRDCTHTDVPQALALSLETKVCIDATCGWVPIKSGVGNVTISCTGNLFPQIRNSRLPGTIVSCP